MNPLDRDRLHRTAKILLDMNLVRDVASAQPYLERFILQIHVGSHINGDLAAQAALLTAVNTGHRAFLGGVRVVIEDNPQLSLPWAEGQSLSQSISGFGGRVVSSHTGDQPILTIGRPRRSVRSDTQVAVWCQGWSGGVTEAPQPTTHRSMPLAGVLAGALGVSEIFQHLLGSPMAARRDVGLSLWCPGLDWQSPEAAGPPLALLPTGIWLLGLGHLGQANAWSLGCLPYKSPNELEVFLVDYDTIIEANHATGLLTRPSDIDKLKTRVVSSRLEQLGYRTRLIERPFDKHLIPDIRDPQLAIAGFDVIPPRRALGGKFRRVVDVGLGAGPTDYLDILIHAFPSDLTPEEAFPERSNAIPKLTEPYEAEIKLRTSQGIELGTARCGVLDLAGATPAAAFVGAIASALSIADLLRLLHGGHQYQTLGVDLRSPNIAIASQTRDPQPLFNPGYTGVRR